MLLFVNENDRYMENINDPTKTGAPASDAKSDPTKTVTQAAAYTGLRPATIRELIKSKVLPATRPGGKLLLIRQSDLDAYLKRNPVVDNSMVNNG